MSGYIGNPDAEAEHALILSENGVEASRARLRGSVLNTCVSCGEDIPVARQQAARQLSIRCIFCIDCQNDDDKKRRNIKMLDRIL